uniref:Uncharacterized protein n=1 Tax=Pithovirus LCDPAC02 TaxID=2506601 RepID=A0A481YQA7_9VIRU|nr:MAG: hypothetical protein LCDPAC02_02960 [Pithovirus LCDPAC02]
MSYSINKRTLVECINNVILRIFKLNFFEEYYNFNVLFEFYIKKKEYIVIRLTYGNECITITITIKDEIDTYLIKCSYSEILYSEITVRKSYILIDKIISIWYNKLCSLLIKDDVLLIKRLINDIEIKNRSEFEIILFRDGHKRMKSKIVLPTYVKLFNLNNLDYLLVSKLYGLNF